MKEIKEIKAVGEWVVLEARRVEAETKKTASGLIMPGKEAAGQSMNTPDHNGKMVVDFFVHSIGEEAKEKLKTVNVGDEVIINDYDAQPCGDGKGNIYCLVKYSNIKCIVKDK